MHTPWKRGRLDCTPGQHLTSAELSKPPDGARWFPRSDLLTVLHIPWEDGLEEPWNPRVPCLGVLGEE